MAKPDQFAVDDESPKKSTLQLKALDAQTIDFDKYEISEAYQKPETLGPNNIKTLPDLVEYLEKNESALIEARVLCYDKKEKKFTHKTLTKKDFLEVYKANSAKASTSLRESFDSFAMDGGGSDSSVIGRDFVPLLGGPFNKQLYLSDYLKMNQLCFFAYHHDPIANRIVNIMRDFTLGRGFKVDFKDEKQQAMWDAFAQVNNLDEMMDKIAIEFSYAGEIMLWWLPNNQTSIVVNPDKDQPVKTGVIPRVRLMDPSMIWEIITWPEDITQVLAYQWVSPTQYQIYSKVDGKDGNKAQSVPSTKYIFQQIPAEEMMHFKVNCAHNEKRGRSDLFPVLGYLKRLRDTVNYSILALQKAAAWAVDTSIDGDDNDIKNYIEQQEELGTIPDAAMEFVHSTKVKREYLGNSGQGSKGNNSSFEWTVSMISAGTGIPVAYLGLHLSSGSTRGSAVVGTEPVAKVFESRQLVYERVLRKIADKVMKLNKQKEYKMEVTFPEVMGQDRTAKLKDIAFAEVNKWISPERAGTMASKELQITDYEWQLEQDDIKATAPDEIPQDPLTAPGGAEQDTAEPGPDLTSIDKSDIKGQDK